VDDVNVSVKRAVEAGFDPARLARIDRFLDERYLASGRYPHVQLLLSRDGEPVHQYCAGAARADGAPLRPDALYRIASMTKPLTSVAFLMLVEEGLVALDTPLHDILPAFAGLRVHQGGAAPLAATRPAAAPVRMIDLLLHTAGFTYSFQKQTPLDAAYFAARLDDFKSPVDRDGMIAALTALPLAFDPGGGWTYSVATDILGFVVEAISGRPLARVFAERIFAPLRMEDSFFEVPANKVDRLTDAWALTEKHGRVLYDAGADGLWTRPRPLHGGGSGLVSTIWDYHRFCRMLMNGGTLDGARLLSPKTVALMTANHLPGGGDLASLARGLFSESGYAGMGFGLGVAVTLDPAASLVPGTPGDYNWGGLFSTSFLIDPREGLILLFMTQLIALGAYPIRRELKTLVHAALMESRA
jgi:CubicO group peptidase (beta-lactamase class C family)